jgi:hypothetical protein
MDTAPLARKTRLIASLIVFSLALPNVAVAQMSAGSTEPVLPDPVPNRGANYPPSAVTADTAYGGPPKMTPHLNCSPLNPCALPSSEPRKLGPLVDSAD